MGWLSLHHLVVWSFDLFFHFGHICFVSANLLRRKGWGLGYLPGGGNPCRFIVVLYVGEVSKREQCHLLSSHSAFSYFFLCPWVNWALLVLIPRRVGLCAFWDPVGLSNQLSCEAGIFSCYCNPHRFFQSEVLRLYFRELKPWVTQSENYSTFKSVQEIWGFWTTCLD